MKVFQQMQDAIQEWQDSRSLIISITRELNCSESEIMGKIEQLKTARPANDLNVINEKLEELQDAVQGGMDRAESVESAVNQAYNELEYVDASDAVAAFSDLESDVEEFRRDVRKQLEESKG
jgi:predicted translin family RNA/ssDNA-binding protein